jgi:hypothetical protein
MKQKEIAEMKSPLKPVLWTVEILLLNQTSSILSVDALAVL